MHLILKVSRLRFNQPLSIRSFRSQNQFSRIFFPTSYLWFLVNLIFSCLSLSYSWKFNWINSFSQNILLNTLNIITACLYKHIFSGSALSAILCICVCVLNAVTPGVQSFRAFADAYFSFLCRFLSSPLKCQTFKDKSLEYYYFLAKRFNNHSMFYLWKTSLEIFLRFKIIYYFNMIQPWWLSGIMNSKFK